MDFTNMEMFDMHAIKLLRRFCNSSGVQIVLSSSWRILHSVEEVAAGLELPVISATPKSNFNRPRGAEIAQWLAENPGVTQWAIIDDDNDMLDSQLSVFVHTNSEEGMTWQNFKQLCEIFNESPYAGVVDEQ